jgi:hypothetical protein
LFNQKTKPILSTFKSEIEKTKTLVYKKPLSIEQEAKIYKATGKLPKYDIEASPQEKDPTIKEIQPEKEEIISTTLKKKSTSRKSKTTEAYYGWTIKGIETETRRAIEIASRKEGMKIGAWCNLKLREAAKLVLTGKNLPITQEALIDEVKADIDTLKKELPKLIKKAFQDNNKSQKTQKGLFQRIFNK